MKKFTGVAYWRGAVPSGWQEQVINTLKPVEGLTISNDGTGLGLSFVDGGINMLDTGGNTQGIVPASSASGALVVCLLALRRVLTALELVDDAQASISVKVRQADPLYTADWARVAKVAETLGLVAGQQFVARHAAVMNRLF